MNWLDTLDSWGFGIAVIRFLITCFVAFIIGYFVGTSQGYLQGVQDGAGVRKKLKSATKALPFDEFKAKRRENAQNPQKSRI